MTRNSLFKLIATPKQVKSYYCRKQGSLRYKATHLYNSTSQVKLSNYTFPNNNNKKKQKQKNTFNFK